MTSTIKTLSGTQFASAFGLRPQSFAWLLGAGASASAGIPTGYMMIREFRVRIFCGETGLSVREVDQSDEQWARRIDDFLSKRNLLPPPGDPCEYAAAFERVFPTPELRRCYIADQVTKGTPSFAHRMLAALLVSGRTPCVFTTNFDDMVEQAEAVGRQLLQAGARSTLTVAAIDSAERALRCLRELDWPLLAKIHGDFQSVRLKNTDEELATQDETMRGVLTSACQRFGLVVVGYSGRDTSVMQALEASVTSATTGAFPGGLFWVTGSPSRLLPAVTQLLAKAAASGVETSIVNVPTFDELAGFIQDAVDLPDVLSQHVFHGRPRARLTRVPPPTTEARKFPVLRCSALHVEQMPSYARRIVLERPATTRQLRDLLKAASVRGLIASTGTEAAAFGNDEAFLRALISLGPRLEGTVPLRPERDSWAAGLLYDALVRALSRKRPLARRLRNIGHAILVDAGRPTDEPESLAARAERLAGLQKAYDKPLTGTVPQLNYPYAEAVAIRLDCFEDRWWCGFEPFTFVEIPRAPEEEGSSIHRPKYSGDPAGDWRRERWARRYNPAWARIIAAWADLLTSGPAVLSALGCRVEHGVDASFKLSKITGWSRPAHHHRHFEGKA